ncbi:sulfotransferase [Nocardioides sp.]|uniref:sulfotransferase family protein n=1 Tax=Nocardioides sp. TaxID=35761 RepID=UPI00273657FA|nr:sulfotransferase [Nocardioides sp.]MDP3893768.1 sulfotransferase [Nocardioides sp.]
MIGGDDVVIIGAPRSGTNMLRDVLTALPGYATWPCDEINLTWRHGNRAFPSDELQAIHATPKVVNYLRSRFDKIRQKTGARGVVEKTCANSLRVEFVHRVKPDARYLFITRDGLDAAASAMARWNAPLDLGYTASKVRFVPPTDLGFYGARFTANLVQKRRFMSERQAVGWWGPKPRDWRELSRTRPLDEVCLLQWQRCVEVAHRGLVSIPKDQVLHLSYEAFVRDPRAGLRDVLTFLERDDLYEEAAISSVSASSIGKGRASLDHESQSRLSAMGRTTLERLGYGG